MKQYTRVFAPIDLDAIAFNMESMKKNLNPGTEMMGVVKADGYGHGAVPAALAMGPYVTGYAAATLEEALVLRRHGIDKMILILGVTHKSNYGEMLENDIRPTIFTMEQARSLSELAEKMHKTACIHLAVDTGMGRIGMTPDEKGADLAAEIAKLPGIFVEGLFTHFARADEWDKASTELQLKSYLGFVDLLKARGLDIPIKHCANSAAIIDLPHMGLNMVRAGISVYGLYPSDEVDRKRVPLKPAMGLKSFVTYIKEIKAGQAVSYGGMFVADKPMTVATIPVGYGDGYPRSLSGKGYVLISGKRAPILGRVCMDQFMVDVSDIPGVKEETQVTLIGRDGNEEITMEALASLCGGFHYELLCDIGKRIPRVYYQGGKIVGTKDYFDDKYEDFFL